MDRRRAERDQHGHVVALGYLARLNEDTHVIGRRPSATSRSLVAATAIGAGIGQRPSAKQPRSRGSALRAAPCRLDGVFDQLVERRGQVRPRAVGREAHLQRARGHVLRRRDLGDGARGEDRRLRRRFTASGRQCGGDVGHAAEIRHQAHVPALAVRIDGRVGDQGETLLEERGTASGRPPTGRQSADRSPSSRCLPCRTSIRWSVGFCRSRESQPQAAGTRRAARGSGAGPGG